MPKINILPKHLAELIAAGEVVERPASVVKELMENSIDAGADKVTVEIKNGGIRYIRITDNGCGISREDIRAAFISHATSKIKTPQDLDSIFTLGFRGEALASVAAVAHIEVMTKTPEEDMGTRYVISGGTEEYLDDAGCPDGTTIIIRDLFYNTPARMKFLKKDMTEGSYVSDAASKIALSHPEVGITLIKDNRRTMFTPGDGRLMTVINEVYGKEFASGLIECKGETESVSVSGYISKPLASRPNRTMQHCFVNGRYVKIPTASAALDNAYRNQIMSGKYPACVLFLQVNPKSVDVNVHPAKTQVRFSNDKIVYDAVYFSAVSALKSKDTPVNVKLSQKDNSRLFNYNKEINQINMTPPNGRISLSVDYEEQETNENSATGNKDKEFNNNSISTGDKNSEFNNNSISTGDKNSEFNNNSISMEDKYSESKNNPPPLETMYKGIKREFYPTKKFGKETEKPFFEQSLNITEKPFFEQSSGATEKPFFENDVVRENERDFFEKEKEEAYVLNSPVQAKTGEQDNSPVQSKTEEQKKKEEFRIVGEVFKTYILAEQSDGLLFIDKHAAHERIIFNRLKNSDRKIYSQMLMTPVTVALARKEYVAVIANLELFRQSGYCVEDFGEGTVRVSECPTELSDGDVREIVLEIADKLSKNSSDPEPEKLSWLYHSTACRSAVKAGDDISLREMEELVNRVLDDDEVRYCPHGRPVMFKMSEYELKKLFGRNG